MPELGLRLLNERVVLKLVSDPERGRYFERVDLPPLTRLEISALSETVTALKHALAPGRRTVLLAMLARLANHRTKERSAQEWKMLFEDYAGDLEEFSEAHIGEAIREHRQTSTFFPSIAELRTRCVELVDRDKFRLGKAERMLADDTKHKRSAA